MLGPHYHTADAPTAICPTLTTCLNALATVAVEVDTIAETVITAETATQRRVEQVRLKRHPEKVERAATFQIQEIMIFTDYQIQLLQ
jgi:hypothetical protein